MDFIKTWIKRFFASLFFTGYIPFGPGTIGSLITVATIFYFKDTLTPFFALANVQTFWFSYLLLLIAAIALSNNAKAVFGKDDPGQITIDEVAGQIITFFLIPLNWKTILLGFVLFRFFDIVKPYPINKFEELDGGLGIVMDDVVAGVMANLSLVAILTLYSYMKTFI